MWWINTLSDVILNNQDLNMVEKGNDLFETQINEKSGTNLLIILK